MITIISGLPGAGKSAFMTCLMRQLYEEQGRNLYERSCAQIAARNAGRITPLTFPYKPPIFSTYSVHIPTGFREYFVPYKLNPYRFGLPNEVMRVQYIFPCSVLFIDEAQGVLDSRASKTLPTFISGAYQKHRPYGMDIYLAAQRPMCIDKNVRDLCPRFLFVMGMEQDVTPWGYVRSTTFHVKEFSSNTDVEQYCDTGEGGKDLPPIVFKYNVFELYDSFEYGAEFYPGEEEDFDGIDFMTEGELPPEEDKIFYESGEPAEFRRTKK